MDTIDGIEGLIGLLETGGLGYLWYLYKRFQKKKAMLKEMEKELQAKTDEIQDLKTDIKMLAMKVDILEKD